jgi:hypothetical protein
MASTELMKIFAPPATASPQQTATVSNTTITQEETTPPEVALSRYYTDADQIPDEFQEDIARATRLGLVVNYPDATFLNPTDPISRGNTAALVHQALVYQDRLEPLPENSAATPYVVEEDTVGGN